MEVALTTTSIKLTTKISNNGVDTLPTLGYGKMFEVPGAKRVCRNDLRTEKSSRSPSPSRSLPDPVDVLRNVYSSTDTYTAPSDLSGSNKVINHEPTGDDAEQEFEFRLFHSPPADSGKDKALSEDQQLNQDRGDGQNQNGQVGGVQKLKIRLRSPSPERVGDGGFVVPFRGWEYYLSEPERVLGTLKQGLTDGTQHTSASGESLSNQSYVEASVSGEEVLERARSTKWPGCNIPWRVIRLHAKGTKVPSATDPSSASRQVLERTHSTGDAKKKRSKPGKKRRIVLRQRVASKKTAEEADKEKRNKRNREKKIKRRQRERDKKAELKVEEAGQEGDE